MQQLQKVIFSFSANAIEILNVELNRPDQGKLNLIFVYFPLILDFGDIPYIVKTFVGMAILAFCASCVCCECGERNGLLSVMNCSGKSNYSFMVVIYNSFNYVYWKHIMSFYILAELKNLILILAVPKQLSSF